MFIKKITFISFITVFAMSGMDKGTYLPGIPVINPATEEGYILTLPNEIRIHITRMLPGIKTLDAAIHNIKTFAFINSEFYALINNVTTIKDLVNLLYIKFDPYSSSKRLDEAGIRYRAYRDRRNKNYIQIAQLLQLPAAEKYSKENQKCSDMWGKIKNLKDAQQLVESGCDINFLGEWDICPLEIVTYWNYALDDKTALSIVKYLTNLGANLNCRDSNNRTLLICAVEKKKLEVVKWLLENGLKPFINEQAYTYRFSGMRSALHIAIEMGNFALVKILIEAAADLTTESTDHTFQTPLQLAHKLHEEDPHNTTFRNILALLEKTEKKRNPASSEDTEPQNSDQ